MKSEKPVALGIGLGVLFLTFAGMWFLGLWNNFLTLCNILISALFASSLWEPVANSIEIQNTSYTYVADFIAVWAVFFLSFIGIRLVTELLCRYRVQFDGVTEYLGRTFICFLAAWIMMCFTMFTLHMAPLKPSIYSGDPTSNAMLVGPDKLWLRFMHSRSKGALADTQNALFVPPYDAELHPDDENLNCRVFDSTADFVFKYRHRRFMFQGLPAVRVSRNN